MNNSKVIIGHVNAFCVKFSLFAGPNQSEFIELLQILTKQDKIIIGLHSNGSVNWGHKDKSGLIKTNVVPDSKFFALHFLDWITAGFMHGYHDENISVETCVKIGIKWGEDECALLGSVMDLLCHVLSYKSVKAICDIFLRSLKTLNVKQIYLNNVTGLNSRTMS